MSICREYIQSTGIDMCGSYDKHFASSATPISAYVSSTSGIWGPCLLCRARATWGLLHVVMPCRGKGPCRVLGPWLRVSVPGGAQVRKRVNILDNKTTSKAIDALLNYETVKLFNNEQLEVRAAGVYSHATVCSFGIIPCQSALLLGTFVAGRVSLVCVVVARGLWDCIVACGVVLYMADESLTQVSLCYVEAPGCNPKRLAGHAHASAVFRHGHCCVDECNVHKSGYQMIARR